MKDIVPKLDSFPASQLQIWPKLKDIPESFCLFGGTAITLQLGHRISVDFDLFSASTVSRETVIESAQFLRNATIIQEAENTLTVLVEADTPVKLSFFGDRPFGLVCEPLNAVDNGLRIASLIDLLAHKLKVILQRSQAKDYLDIAAIIESGVTLQEGLSAASAIFVPSFPVFESIKAITYFGDGDLATLPQGVQKLLIKEATGISPRIHKFELYSESI